MKTTPSLFRYRIVACILFISTLMSSLADYTLGRMGFSHAASMNLKTTTPLKISLGKAPRMGFVRKVGGVSFDAIAIAADNFEVPKMISIEYDQTSQDGQRLKMKFDNKSIKTEIYDWELLPIIRYADSDSTSCFTLFGSLKDKAEQDRLMRQGARILNYDKAFEDTLLGFRLFQLDVLILDPEFSTDIPMEKGEYLLGLGEVKPNLPNAKQHLKAYENEVSKLRRRSTKEDFKTDFRSYVICDYGATVSFKATNGKLDLTGEPYYYFWKPDPQKSVEHYFLAELTKRGLLKKNETLDDFFKRKQQEAQNSDTPAATLEKLENKLKEIARIARKNFEANNGDDTKGLYLKKALQQNLWVKVGSGSSPS